MWTEKKYFAYFKILQVNKSFMIYCQINCDNYKLRSNQTQLLLILDVVY